jgi:hypothetical protein
MQMAKYRAAVWVNAVWFSTRLRIEPTVVIAKLAPTRYRGTAATMTRMRLSSNDSISLTTRALGWSGLLPFVGGALAVGVAPPIWHDTALRALIAYGAVIVSFLGGIHWGSPTGAAHDSARLWGVVPSLLAWPLLLMPSSRFALIGVAAALALCWAVDRARFPAMGLSALLPLRTLLSSVAILSCLVAAAFTT